ncbi:MAG TPA: hypothetical protein VGC25_00535 [Alphaproteobacteria bacterium]|jgi:mannose-6-phosphate isomerase-like protein (cupin superfamily)
MASIDVTASEDREARHREAESRVQDFRFVKPTDLKGNNKALVRLCRSDILQGLVQVIKDGGENNLHYHDGMDSFWMVLKGRAAFYGPGDKLIGEYGPMEGILTPRGARYWFAKASEEDLELLHVTAYERDNKSHSRIDVSGKTTKKNRNLWLDGRKGNAELDRSRD